MRHQWKFTTKPFKTRLITVTGPTLSLITKWNHNWFLEKAGVWSRVFDQEKIWQTDRLDKLHSVETKRQFPDINGGNVFLAKQDRPNNIAIVGIYELNPKLTFSATWIFISGNVVTFPSGRYAVDGIIVPYYTERNGYRMPDYHRLDIGLTLQGKKTATYESNWNFSIYNVYGRANAYAINFQQDPNDPLKCRLFNYLFSVLFLPLLIISSFKR